MAKRHISLLFLTIVLLGFSSVSYAHSGAGLGGLISGLSHPISGLDHVAAMFAVGLLGAFMGRPAIWVLPIVFPVVMAFGGVLGLEDVPLPFVEVGIALSSIVLGIMIALGVKPILWVAALIVGVFAIFHGYAHGQELPNAADPLAYSAGFVIATGLLHLVGILFGELTRWPMGNTIIRVLGGLITLLGIYFLVA